MDNQLLEAICERLVTSLIIQGSCVFQQGIPVTKMLFIIRGSLESFRSHDDYSNSIVLKPGDFCGEELLAWALLSTSGNLPSSTRTVKALIDVEAFALRAEDLQFVTNQFRQAHSKTLQHAFRFYSHQWRNWAACRIQVAWRHHRKRLMNKYLTALGSSFKSATSNDLVVTEYT